MKPRTYTVRECDLRIEEFELVITGCDQATEIIDDILRMHASDDALDARSALSRVRTEAQRAYYAWTARKELL